MSEPSPLALQLHCDETRANDSGDEERFSCTVIPSLHHSQHLGHPDEICPYSFSDDHAMAHKDSGCNKDRSSAFGGS